ncbi:hypothetical protein WL90_02455 [Burkholderia cenocepacia]|nr:hypothetical protein WL90_02455 [Burkholderia cenocepacia]
MNRVSQFVNNFLNDFVATAGLNFRAAKARYLPNPYGTASLPPAPRFRWRERGVILSTCPHPCKRFCEESLKKPPCAHAHGGF